jgi:hypothetical protein
MQRRTLSVFNLRAIIELFNSIYEEFSAKDRSGIALVKKEQDFPPANKIKALLKSEERKPMSVLNYMERNPGPFPKIYKNKSLTKNQTHKVIDISCGLIYDIFGLFKNKFDKDPQIQIARDYMYIKLTIGACDHIIRILKHGISDEILSCHSHLFKICEQSIVSIRNVLEENKDLSEQFNTVIELLTNKLCFIKNITRKNLFDVDLSNVE